MMTSVGTTTPRYSSGLGVTSFQTTSGNVTDTVEDEWQLLIRRYQLQPLSAKGSTACAIYLLLVGIVATFGNATTLLMFSRNKKLRRKPHNVLLMNLAVSDLGISVFGYPLTTASCFAHRWLFGPVGCQVQGFTTFVFALADMYTLTLVGVYRWVAVCLPHHNHRLNMCMTFKAVASVWFISCIICGLPLVGMSRYTYEPFGTSCTIDWDWVDTLNIIYVCMLIVVAYVVPVGIMCYCYAKVAIRSSELTKVTKACRKATLNLKEAEEANHTLAENKVTWVSFLMVIVFVVIWSPYTFVCVWAICVSKIPAWANTLPTMCCKATCMLNPVIFFITSPVFRNTFKETFTRNRKVGALTAKAGSDRMSTFKVDKTKEGVFIGERDITFKKTESFMF